MKKNKVKRISLFSLLMLLFISISLILASCAFKDQDRIKYKKVEGGYEINKFTGSSITKKYKIEEAYKGEKIIGISDFCFSNNEYLESIEIPKSIKKIGTWAFSNCIKLKSIDVDVENKNFLSSDGVLFSKDKTVLLAFPNNSHGAEFDSQNKLLKTSTYQIPSTVKIVGEKAFYRCEALKSIIIPEGVVEIRERAFTNCTRLEEIKLPSTLTTLGVDAFSEVGNNSSKENIEKNYKTLVIPSKVVKIGSYAFFKTPYKEIKLDKANEKNIKLGKDWYPIKRKPEQPVNIIWEDR